MSKEPTSLKIQKKMKQVILKFKNFYIRHYELIRDLFLTE